MTATGSPPPDDTAYRAIIVGSGIAGLSVALEVARTGRVLVLSKGGVADGSTGWAQGGIAAAVPPAPGAATQDSPALHLADTIGAGAGLVDEAAARVLCEEAPAVIAALTALGVPWDRLPDGQLALAREAAHSVARVLHAGGDQTGAVIGRVLGRAAQDAGPGIVLRDGVVATALIVEGGRCTGVEALDLDTGRQLRFAARAVVLATGGAGQLYSHTTNPEVVTGDGIALAFAAGAEVADMEFVQFHPTALRLAGVRPFLISEAIRGEGAILRDAAGIGFMAEYSDAAELAPRDVVARAISARMVARGDDCVFLDCRHLKFDLHQRFPSISAFLKEHGLDLARDPIPVAPAAHYLMGGVRTDLDGRTTLAGLFAVGETARTGAHGANRVASNSLLEAAVFGRRAGIVIASGELTATPQRPDAISIGGAPHAAGGPPVRKEIQALMWSAAGIVRTGDGLSRALRIAGGWGSAAPGAAPENREAAQMAVVARLILQSALRREESRGAHFREDYPARDDAHWQLTQVFRRAD